MKERWDQRFREWLCTKWGHVPRIDYSRSTRPEICKRCGFLVSTERQRILRAMKIQEENESRL